MGKRSRDKGARGEREFIQLVSKLTHGQVQLSRNLSQCRDGGDDCLGHDELSIEVKRRKQAVGDALVSRWWRVCVDNARRCHKRPVLAWRQDTQRWKVMIHPNHLFDEDDVRGGTTIDIELFCRGLTDPGGLGFPPLKYHGGAS